MRTSFAAAAALAMTVTATGAGLSPAAAAPPTTAPRTAATADAAMAYLAPPITWGDCEAASLRKAGGVCGFLKVPLDWAKPHGRTIELAVSKIAHQPSAGTYQGVMLTNPGGPGGSGLTLSVLGQYVPNDAGSTYDWIGFDPRGVGSSKPALSCLPDYMKGPRPSYIPSTPALAQTWLARSAAYAAACGANGGDLLDHVKTTDTVRDMDAIRTALGAQKINFFGFSYGTYLGQVYATMFPQRVRRMVLDSNVDPRKVWYQANLDQDVAFERNINIWFGWVARYDSVYHLGKTRAAVSSRWYAEQAELAKNPTAGLVGADEWTDIFLGAAYYESTWTELGDLFAGWAHHRDTAALVAAYEDAESVGDDNGFAMYNAVQCSDVQWPTSWPTWRKDNWATYRKAPFETWSNAWYNAPCLTWPAKPGKPVTVDGSKAPAILLIGQTLDAATPYPGNVQVRQLFPKARLIGEAGGTTHAGTLYGNACVDDRIAAYLATGALPKRKAGSHATDVVCQPLPQPVPAGAAAAEGALPGALRTRVDTTGRDALAELGRLR